jgi:hypothetical protein
MLKKIAAGLVTATVLGVGGLAGANALAPSSGASSVSQPAATRVSAHSHRHLRARLAFIAKTVADAIGIDVPTLRDGIKSGQTIAQIASAHGKQPADVVTALVNAADAKVDQALSDAKIDAARAARIKARIPKRADKIVNDTQAVIARLRHRTHTPAS